MRRRLRNVFGTLALLLAALVAGGILVEAALAALGYSARWGYTSSWALDDLRARYRLRPGVYPDLADCAARINRLGARGPEPVHPRVLCLGDSCTFGVGLPEESVYASLLGARGLEALNAGVPGYNSLTGLHHLQDSGLLALRPEIVTIYFGWNDHWRGLATEEAFYRVRRLARYSRAASILLRLQACLWSNSPRWRPFRWVAQVPLPDFKDNLRLMVAASRLAGARVVLITAPTEPRLIALDKSDFFDSRSLAEFADHPRYAQAVRDVAAETGAGLIDLDAELARRASGDPHMYFLDFVHLNAKGHRLLADMILAWAAAGRPPAPSRRGLPRLPPPRSGRAPRKRSRRRACAWPGSSARARRSARSRIVRSCRSGAR